MQSNNEGVPFVLASPDAQVSRDLARVATMLVESPAPAATRR